VIPSEQPSSAPVPTARITIHENFWDVFLEIITFGIHHNDEQIVEIEAESSIGIASIEYYISETDMTKEEAELLEYISYDNDEKPILRKGSSSIVYAKITDNNETVIYIRSDVIIVENINDNTQEPPVTSSPVVSPTVSPTDNQTMKPAITPSSNDKQLKRSIKIKFRAMGGKIGKKKAVTIKRRYGMKIKLPKKPVRKFYKFKGWYTKKKGGKKVTKKTKVPIRNTIYYARWKRKGI
jgi:uncharacterized repeat protein (TIGR02543 family)